jgi:isopentenyl phosphate kinase
MSKTVVIKIGGSVVTYKQRTGLYIRRSSISSVASEIKSSQNADSRLRVVIVHGAGTAGHQLAKKYNLTKGTVGDVEKNKAALSIQRALQKLNGIIVSELSAGGLMAMSVHTASVIKQSNGNVSKFLFDAVDGVVSRGFIPVMYGDMVVDHKLGMSVCSGDIIAMMLAKRYHAEKIIFASDVNGIYDKDPHHHSSAKMIRSITLDELRNSRDIALTGSHNVDVTGGLGNKIIELSSGYLSKQLKKVVICNGLRPHTIERAFTDNEDGTVIRI